MLQRGDTKIDTGQRTKLQKRETKGRGKLVEIYTNGAESLAPGEHFVEQGKDFRYVQLYVFQVEEMFVIFLL